MYNAVYLEAGIYHGGTLLAPAIKTNVAQIVSSHARWNQWMKFNITVRCLPKVCICGGMWSAIAAMSVILFSTLWNYHWSCPLKYGYSYTPHCL